MKGFWNSKFAAGLSELLGGSGSDKGGIGPLGGYGVEIAAVLAISLLLAILLATRWLVDRRKQREAHSPHGLFHELITAHKLASRERQLLKRLAQHWNLENPALLFVEAEWWTAERLGPSWTKALPAVEQLRKRLFAPR
jgi:hypothetical protein